MSEINLITFIAAILATDGTRSTVSAVTDAITLYGEAVKQLRAKHRAEVEPVFTERRNVDIASLAEGRRSTD